MCVFCVGLWEAESISVTGALHQEIKITCSHTNAGSNVKYFCRGDCGYEDVLITSRVTDKDSKRKYSIKDEGNTFFVTIYDLKETDSGLYWCGIERAGVDTYNRVDLIVTKGEVILYIRGCCETAIARNFHDSFVLFPLTTMWSLFHNTVRLVAFFHCHRQSLIEGNKVIMIIILTSVFSGDGSDLLQSYPGQAVYAKAECLQVMSWCVCIQETWCCLFFRDAGVHRSRPRRGCAGSGHSSADILQIPKERNQHISWYETKYIFEEYFQNMTFIVLKTPVGRKHPKSPLQYVHTWKLAQVLARHLMMLWTTATVVYGNHLATTVNNHWKMYLLVTGHKEGERYCYIS